jgi:3-oxoacyl-[acyl-carrier protein] reductase
MMELNIKGRTAVITGASAGIGLAIAQELAAQGTHLVMIARNAERLEAAAREIAEHYGVQTMAIAGDVASAALPERVAQQAQLRFGGIDLLVNNAGRAHSGGLMETTEEEWHSMTEIKFSAMRRFCRAVIPSMRQRGWGRIVNISSIGGIYPNPHLMVSHALSAAINNFTKALALEVAADGILVNAIGVGAVATDNWEHNMLPGVRQRRPELHDLTDEQLVALLGKERTPTGRFGRPEDIAAAAVFLLSARNAFITGHTLEASGGADRFM